MKAHVWDHESGQGPAPHLLQCTAHAGLFVRKVQQGGAEVGSSLASVRVLFDKAEQNQKGNRDSLQLASLLTSADEAAQDPSSTGLPYGRYHPISMLLIRQALLPYNPSWMGVRIPFATTCSRVIGVDQHSIAVAAHCLRESC